MGFSSGSLPTNIKRLEWAESGRFVTVPQARQWVNCETSYATELPAGDHTIYWFAGDVVGETVVFDAGVRSVQAFPLDARSPGRNSKKLALLVGINEYRAADISGLRGCVDDVRDMQDLLISRFGFAAPDVRTLINEQATHEGIVTAFQKHLVGRADENTITVFYYSGHGSQMTDWDGDEPDGLDETIVSHDSRTPGHYDITDDEIRGLFTQLSKKTKYVTFIFDSCHSGAITRDRGGVAKWVQPDRRPAPPGAKTPSYAVLGRGIIGDRSRNYIQISGCRDDELSFEMSLQGRRRGAMTYFFTQVVRVGRAKASPIAKWRSWSAPKSPHCTRPSTHRWRAATWITCSSACRRGRQRSTFC